MLTHPNKLFLERGASSLRTTPELDGDPQLDLLANPDSLFALPQCQIIKDQRKIKVGRLQLEIGGKVVRVYLKRYNAFSWRYRLGSLFIPSGASRSWEGASILLSAGFRTGRPIAAVECRSWCMLDKSFYLSEEIPGGKTADAYWQEALAPVSGPEGFRRRRRFLENLAKLFRSLHALNIYHNDLKDANILVCSGDSEPAEAFYLLDLEGIRSYRYLSRRRQVKNLVQLNRTMGRCLSGGEKLCWLQAYLGSSYGDRKARRKWIRDVLRESNRRDLRSLRKG